jgi:zinc finger protein
MNQTKTHSQLKHEQFLQAAVDGASLTGSDMNHAPKGNNNAVSAQKECNGDVGEGISRDDGSSPNINSQISEDVGGSDGKNLTPIPTAKASGKPSENDICIINQCLCPNCGGGEATTVLLPTTIPGFRETLVMTLTCETCSFRNSQVTYSGEIQPYGERTIWTIKKDDAEFLNRQILKSESATIRFPTLDDLEIPSTTQQGVLTTVEGMLQRVKDHLSSSQPERLRLGDLDNFYRCQSVVDRIQRLLENGKGSSDEDAHDDYICDAASLFPFQLIMDDPAGNSFLENPYAPDDDPHVRFEKYERTPNQDLLLGLQPSLIAHKDWNVQNDKSQHKRPSKKMSFELCEYGLSHFQQEGLSIPTTCPQCNKLIDTKICTVNIPHFQEIILFCTLCEYCRYKSNEIKSGGGIPTHGSRLILQVSSQNDLKRDIMKSDTAGIEIPEIDFQMGEGSLGGVYTTIEGLIRKVKDRLVQANPFVTGDSAIHHYASNDAGGVLKPNPQSERFHTFLQTLSDMSEGKGLPFTLVVTDPLANSFIGPSPGMSGASCPRMKAPDLIKDGQEIIIDNDLRMERFNRTVEQDEILGITDMRTENYHE